MAEHEYQIVLTSCPDSDTASALARELVEARLAAAVNILPAGKSVYVWQQKVRTASEHLLLVKSATQNYPEIEAHIRSSHPYELPAILAVPIADASPDYLRWLENPWTIK
ncbi:MAG: divalent-cation tolerance protein CutA [Acidiferrobacterales bacterium]